MTTDERTRPADMTIPELDAALARLTAARREAPNATRKLVITSLMDRLLDERGSRRISDPEPTAATTASAPATDAPTR